MNKECQIVIWGTKLEAEKALFKCKQNKITCSYIIDNYQEGKFHGYEIKRISQVELVNEFCVVACSEFSTYSVIKKQLEDSGRKEFEDFIWSKLWLKKIVVINANCHGSQLARYLEFSEEFNCSYAIYPVPEIWMNKKKEIDENLLSNTDVYIHQDIRKENKISEKLADDYILPRIKPEAINICIPNMVGYGNIKHMFCYEGGYRTQGNNPVLLFFKDELLDRAYENIIHNNENMSMSNLLTWISQYDFTDYEENFENVLSKIKEREVNWDIKVSHYIELHRNDIRLFNDINHPGNSLMKYICDEIIKKMGFTPVDFYEFGMGAEVYSCPYINGDNNQVNSIRYDNTSISLTNKPFENYEDYVRQYIWLMYDQYLE